jgi:hypothetical protein
VRCWAALRVMPKDGFPIYDQSDSCPGAFIATCHSGVTLAANHALVLPPRIDAGTLRAAGLDAKSLDAKSLDAESQDAESLHAFRARRFNVSPPQ